MTLEKVITEREFKRLISDLDYDYIITRYKTNSVEFGGIIKTINGIIIGTFIKYLNSDNYYITTVDTDIDEVAYIKYIVNGRWAE